MLRSKFIHRPHQSFLRCIHTLNQIKKSLFIACKDEFSISGALQYFDVKKLHKTNFVSVLQDRKIESDLSKINWQKVFQEKENEFKDLQSVLMDSEKTLNLTSQQKSLYHKKVQFLQPIISQLHEIKKFQGDINELKELINELKLMKEGENEEMMKIAVADMDKAEMGIETAQNKVLTLLTPDEEEDSCNIMIEVTNGIGGQEAMTFSREIFNMYQQYGHWKGWNVQVLCDVDAEQGGLQKGVLNLKGENVYKYLKFESGVHRVQRHPPGKKSVSKLHTSTCCVIILPEPEEIHVEIQQKDLLVQYKRASGAGGQHVNTTDSAVRVTHLPTKTAVDCQVNRSQIQNYKLAMNILKAKLYKMKLDEHIKQEQESRKLQVQSSERSEKIRTYNFPKDRITDHRISENVHGITEFMKGGPHFDNLVNTILEKSKQEKLSLLLKTK